MTTTTDTIVTARVKAFSREGIRTHRCMVEADGMVRVWDPIGQHYTARHRLSDYDQQRIRRLASATSLESLYALLASGEIALTEILPVFGEDQRWDAPDGILSWNDTHMIVGTCVDDLAIVSRDVPIVNR